MLIKIWYNEVKKIRYEDFKMCNKYNLKTEKNGTYTCGKPEEITLSKIKIEDETTKVVLTKKDNKECDLLNITSLGGDINYFQFIFFYFNHSEEKWYKFSIERKRENVKFLRKINDNNIGQRKWGIQVSEIEETGIERRNGACISYPDSSGEVMEIKRILFENRKMTEEKIVDLVNYHNYNNYSGTKNKKQISGDESLDFKLKGEETDVRIQ